MDDDLELLQAHISRTTGISQSSAARLVAEVIEFFTDPVEGFVHKRHTALQASGLRNDAIYTQIQRELGERRFAAPQLTTRQIRRIIYG
ncbi:MAG: hypothetical protein OET44_16605 [Gammaproteobacteria bacterium]|nr:hypothetical protein [Gammaproteobacteria bacterium]